MLFERIAVTFRRQQVMATLGAELEAVEPGVVTIALPYSEALTQQHGFLHAGVVATVMDSACGYAAYTLMPEDAGVLSIEFKTNLLAPARGKRFRFVGTVVKAGRTISVCEGKAFADDDKLIATMTCTLMTIRDREGVTG
ncbi:MAG: phenylacetic acid degradation protein [Cyanobacteria bacterium RYN_339]|nr:phenylacetic acid degradation protein [Cyanobacteria bacterium RYN_339]